MKLTAVGIKTTKPADKPIKLFDGGGLYLLIQPNGAKYWRLKYRFGGKEKMLSIGVYPDVSLSEARERRETARKLLSNGADPSVVKKAQKAAVVALTENSFEIVAREWFSKHAPNWKENHSSKIIARLEKDIFPWIGAMNIGEIAAPALLATVRRIEARGALETAHRALSCCGQVFRYAVATGRAERDPTGDLRGALPPVRKDKHFAAITDPKTVGELMRDIDGYQGSFIVKCAFRLSPMLFVRPGELRKMEWAEVDLDKAEWIDFIVAVDDDKQGREVFKSIKKEMFGDDESLAAQKLVKLPGCTGIEDAFSTSDFSKFVLADTGKVSGVVSISVGSLVQ